MLESARPFLNRYRFHVCTFKEPTVVESYDRKIRELAEAMGCTIIPIWDYQADLRQVIEHYRIDSVLCISWRYLIPPMIIAALAGNVVIAHDSLLPKFRGFAPLVTAMIVGEKRTGVTFLRAGAGTDDGPILWQNEIAIEPTDTIQSMIDKLIPLYKRGAELFFAQALKNERSQDDSQASYSIWRDRVDLEIDWNLDAERIERTIRALGAPYSGAHTRLDGEPIVIHNAALCADVNFAIRQPGKIWELDHQGRPTVVCGQGLLRIIEATMNGESVFPLKKLRGRFG